MELSQVAKARKKGKGPQAANQRTMVANPGKTAGEVADALHASPTPAFHGMPVDAKPPPRPPRKPLSPRAKWGIGAGALAAGGTGAYLYQRRRAEKSLSSMQRDF